MNVRKNIHEIVDKLSDAEFDTAKRLLERLHDNSADPMLVALAAAPYDDEPSSAEEDASCREAWEQRQDGITLDEARRELLSE